MLSRTGEYSIRAAVCIAEHYGNGPMPAEAIARRTRVPARYLHKVLRDLVRGGVLVSARGLGGGFRLARDPSRVSLADVIAPFESPAQRRRCPFGKPRCGVGRPCPIHERWSRVTGVYREFLSTTTLADLIGKKPSSRRSR